MLRQDEVHRYFNMAAKVMAVVQNLLFYIIFIGYFVVCKTVSDRIIYRANFINILVDLRERTCYQSAQMFMMSGGNDRYKINKNNLSLFL